MINTPSTASKVVTAKEPPHHLRTLTAALFGTIALVLVLVGILAVWLNQTLTNTQLFTDTLAPLASQADLQNYIADTAANQVAKSAPPRDLAQGLLTDENVAGKTDDQLRTEVQARIKQDVLRVLERPAFAALWRTTLRSLHNQVLAQLRSNSATMTLNLAPVVQGVMTQLQGTQLATIAAHMGPIDPKALVITLNGGIINKARQYYQWFNEGTLGVVAVALFAGIICVLVSVHHLRTLRRILMGTGVIALLLAGGVFSAAAAVPKTLDPSKQKAAAAIASTLFHNLQLACLVLGIGCIVLALGSKAYSMVLSRRAA